MESLTKTIFFFKYRNCADEATLEKIWQARFSQAKSLNISHSKISDLIPLSNLVHLQKLLVSNTQVSDLSPLKNLVNLRMLYIHDTQVSDLSPLKNLVNLVDINVCNTQVSDLSPLKDLTNLQKLNIGNTQVKDLYPLKNLSNLEAVSVFYTQVSDLSPLKDLTNLIFLDVNETQVSDLSPLKNLIEKGIEVEWQELSWGKGIHIQNLPLSNPPIEIAKQGNAAILRYWKEQERAGTITLNEARLLIVGQGGAGKTTLRKKLMQPNAALPEPDMTTRGIEVEYWNFPRTEGGDFILHIWDFGGQNIQHYAHQFFLSDSVVYALVHSEREQNEHSSYWLNIMELLGKTSPVLLVQNEKFGHSADLKDYAGIRERFGNVRNYHKVDLSQAKNADYKPFQDLAADIQHLAGRLPHVGKTYLRSFNDVRLLLKDLAATQHHISWTHFEDLCAQQGIENRELMRDYARYFHQLGIALWFEDDLDLENLVFLNPKWIIDALFELLYDDKAIRQKPLISVNDVRSIWRGEAYRGMHGNLLRLMRNFEMCYEVAGDTPQYIVPQLLPADRAEYKPPADATKVVFQYRFLPKGFLTRLTCRLHKRIRAGQVWNDAVQFEDQLGATVFAKEIYAQNAIELIAEGKGKRQLLNEVINTLNDINTGTKFENLKVKTYVPCPCSVCQSSDDPYQFEYLDLKASLTEGETEEKCRTSRKRLKIKDILREVNAFSFNDIRRKVAQYKLTEALNILRGRFPENNEVVMLQSQARRLGLNDISGVQFEGERNLADNQIIQRILNLIDVLESDEND